MKANNTTEDINRIIELDKFLVEVAFLTSKEDYSKYYNELINLRSYYYEYVYFLLRIGYTIPQSIVASSELFKISRMSNLTLYDIIDLMPLFNKVFLIKQLTK